MQLTRFSLPFALMALLLGGCSGGDFATASPADEVDAGEDVVVDSGTPGDTNVEDSSTADTSVVDTDVADTNVADTNVADINVADTNVADTNVATPDADAATPDTSTSDTFSPDSMTPDTATADTSPPDTCVLNACGGCSPLDHVFGASCGGKCGSAKYECDPSDPTKTKTVCKDPVTTAAPGTVCGGKCGSAKYQCKLDGLSTECVDPVTTPAPLTGCGGKCGSATYECKPDLLSTHCVDPVTTPAEGTDCTGALDGKCGSATYQCATDKKSTSCVDPVPASSPSDKAKCGVCGSSVALCNEAKTDVVCQVPDDRSMLVAPIQTAATTWGGADADRITQHLVQLTTTANQTRIAAVSLLLARRPYNCYDYDSGSECVVPDPACTCDCGWNPCVKASTGADALTLELVAGTPAVPGGVLDTASVTPTDVPAWALSTTPSIATTFSFTKDLKLPAGTKVFLRVVVKGGGQSYQAYGKVATTSSTHRLLTKRLSDPVIDPELDPYLVVRQYVCSG